MQPTSTPAGLMAMLMDLLAFAPLLQLTKGLLVTEPTPQGLFEQGAY